MAHPFVQAPTWSEIIEKLKKFDVSFKQEDGVEVCGPDGANAIHYLERETEHGAVRYVVCFESQDERLVPSLIHSICANLEVDPAEFGLTLD